MLLFVFTNCGGAAESLGDEAGADEALDGADSAPLVEGVRYVTLRNPDADAAATEDERCRTVLTVIERRQNHQFCFRKGGEETPSMTLYNEDGEEVLHIEAGSECAVRRLDAGDYEMEICHGGGNGASSANLVFIAPEDVSKLPDDAADIANAGEEDDPDGGFDYGEEEAGGTAYARWLSASDNNTFLTTNTCVRCDLSGGDFSGMDFTVVTAFATLTGSDLSNADLSGADLTNAVMNKVNLDGADLSGAILSGANLSSATMQSDNLSGATLTGTLLVRTRLDNADLTNADLSTANLSRARLTDATLNGADLGGANLSNASAAYADFTGATLNAGATLTSFKAGGADFTNATFAASNLTGAYFNAATMTNAVFTTATLAKARFVNADLTGANLNTAVFNMASSSQRPNWSGTVFDGATWQAGESCLASSLYDPATRECEQ